MKSTILKNKKKSRCRAEVAFVPRLRRSAVALRLGRAKKKDISATAKRKRLVFFFDCTELFSAVVFVVVSLFFFWRDVSGSRFEFFFYFFCSLFFGFVFFCGGGRVNWFRCYRACSERCCWRRIGSANQRWIFNRLAHAVDGRSFRYFSFFGLLPLDSFCFVSPRFGVFSALPSFFLLGCVSSIHSKDKQTKLLGIHKKKLDKTRYEMRIFSTT